MRNHNFSANGKSPVVCLVINQANGGDRTSEAVMLRSDIPDFFTKTGNPEKDLDLPGLEPARRSSLLPEMRQYQYWLRQPSCFSC